MKRRYLDNSEGHDFNVDALFARAQQASVLLKALAHETRLLILCLLTEEEKSVTAIEGMLNLRQPAISQQLARLRADGLVETRRDGKNIFYSLARPEVREIVAVLHRVFCQEPRSRVSAANGRAVARAPSSANGAAGNRERAKAASSINGRVRPNTARRPPPPTLP